MNRSWTLLEADAEERAAFTDLATTLRLPWTPAAPPNRLRHVRRVQLGERICFVKVFEHTQWKNRMRGLWAAPHVVHDAQREAAVASALRAAGFAAARPIAVGTDGPRSVYVCAELPGSSLLAQLRAGAADRHLLRAAAGWAGSIAQAGFLLPDLKLEHIHVLPGAQLRFGVLDLHNGRLGTRVRRRDALRWLRHLRQELVAVPLGPTTALGVAAHLLTSAGLGAARRELLRAVPPLSTHSRYDVPGRSAGYRERNPARARRELALLLRVWPGRADESVLDVPCGTGRFATALPGRWCGLDRSHAMARAAAAIAGARVAVASADRLPLADRSVDGVLQFRFLHHLAPDQARAALAEATRVARRFLVLSHFHPLAVHGLRRRLLGRLLRRPHTRHSVWPAELQRWLAAHGFVPQAAAAEGWLRELRIAVFVRAETAGAARDQAFLRPAAFSNESNA